MQSSDIAGMPSAIAAVRIRGGLGNQLFQYAFAEALGQRAGSTRIVLDTQDYLRYKKHDGFLLSRLNLPLTIGTDNDLARVLPGMTARYVRALYLRLPRLAGGRIVREDRRPGMSFNIPFDRSWYVGYWQDASVANRGVTGIERAFRKPIDDARSTLQEQGVNGSRMCAIHVRRGDLLALAREGKAVFYDLAFYEACIAFVRSRLGAVQFLVFSDDVPWCRASFGGISGIHFANDLSISGAIEEMAAMACCSSHIFSNSTFGWWGARLAAHPALCVFPKQWGGLQHAAQFRFEDRVQILI